MSNLDARLLAAHEADDRASLIHLYKEAADQAKDANASGFYLTQAFIFALEVGAPEATALEQRLQRLGRV